MNNITNNLRKEFILSDFDFFSKSDRSKIKKIFLQRLDNNRKWHEPLTECIGF